MSDEIEYSGWDTNGEDGHFGRGMRIVGARSGRFTSEKCAEERFKTPPEGITDLRPLPTRSGPTFQMYSPNVPAPRQVLFLQVGSGCGSGDDCKCATLLCGELRVSADKFKAGDNIKVTVELAGRNE